MSKLESRYLQYLAQGVLVYDGAMGTSLQQQNLSASDFGGDQYWGCNDYLVIAKPSAVEQVHRSFLDVGVNVLETDTFRSNRLTLREYGLQDRVVEINQAAAQLARRLAAEYDSAERPRFVAGSIGPSGLLPSSTDPVLSNITFGELVETFREQAVGLLLGGVDVLLIETSQDILEVKAAIFGIQRAFGEVGRRVPLQCQVTLDTSGRMLLGTDIAAALTTLQSLPIDLVGLNCSTGPDHMREPIRYLTENAALPVSCIPNAGLPINTGVGEAVYPETPDEMAAALGEFVHKRGVRVVGGCCGTTPAHLTAILKAVHDRPAVSLSFTYAPRARDGWTQLRRTDAPDLALLSSAMRATSMTQDPPPMLIGERVNAQGSRKVKRLLLEDRYEDIVTVAREQVEGGAHTLDVQVALTERVDEAEQMGRLAHLLSTAVEAPLVIDTTEADVVKAALEQYPGRGIINSVNLERGRERIDTYLPLVKAHGAAVMALTIDEQGMAHEVERKVEIARRIYDIVVGEYGLPPHDLIFDPQVFPVTTGQAELREDAKWTIEGIRQIKAALPGVLTSIGVSNVSFGLQPPARAVLNSVFLYHAVKAGLDMAIVNPVHITPYAEIDAEQRQLAEDLIFNRSEDALPRYITYWEGRTQTAETHEREDPTAGMTVEQKLRWQIVHRKKEGVEDLVDQAVANAASGGSTNDGAVQVLNTVMLPAMKEVGDKFGAGELILPFVLQSAEVMKRAVVRLETYLERLEGTTKGRVVLATVFGDVHDIGKNLVNTILSNNGYTVYDLGKQVPINTIIDKALEVNADAIGLSALLVSTSKQMPLCVQELHHRGLDIPVLIGGAAINRRFGRRALFVDDQGTPYAPGVFYCRDAFEGLETMDALQDPTRRPALVQTLVEEARNDIFLNQSAESKPEAKVEVTFKPLDPAPDIPTPPFWGWRLLEDVPLDDVMACLDTRELFRLAWGARGAQGAAFERLVEQEFKPRLASYQERARREGWLKPAAIYGYFPAQSDGDTLIVYDPASVPFPTRNRLADRGQVLRAGAETRVMRLPTVDDGPRTTEGGRMVEPVSVVESISAAEQEQGRQEAVVGRPSLREAARSSVVPPRELARFTFPRQKNRGALCLADYFAPVSSGTFDTVAFQVVTVGDEADNLSDTLMQGGDYTEGYYLHGFSVEMAEAMAEYTHRHIRQELGLAPGRGLRYSWGYPACPDLADHEKVFALMPVEQELGVSLTSAYQLVPEQSTAALVVHHPQAIYFAAL